MLASFGPAAGNSGNSNARPSLNPTRKMRWRSAPTSQSPALSRSGYAGLSGKKRHYNPIGTVHGGWIATLLDSCVGCAVHSTLPAGKAYTTAELKVNYVRAVTARVPLLRAIGTVIHVGGRMATADGRLVGPDGKLYAHASTTCFIFDAT